jgi:hypothetical protein
VGAHLSHTVLRGEPVSHATVPQEKPHKCDGHHFRTGQKPPNEDQQGKQTSSNKGARDMTMRRFGTYAIDIAAVAVGLVIAVPFALLLVAPFMPVM